MINWTSEKKIGGKSWKTDSGSSWLGMEEEGRAVKQLAGSWLSLINSVGSIPGDVMDSTETVEER